MTLQDIIENYMKSRGYSNEHFIPVEGWKAIAEEYARIKSQEEIKILPC